MPRGQPRERDPTLIQVLSLYLLLLAFFVILFNISKAERFKTAVVAQSLNSTFADRGQATETPNPLTSTLGQFVSDQAFQQRIGQLITAEIPIAEVEEIKPGSVLVARIPVESLFEGDDVARVRRPWTRRLAQALGDSPAGMRYDVDVMIGIGAAGESDADADTKMQDRDLSLTRAGRLAARLVDDGAPSGQVAAGLERRDPKWMRLLFYVRGAGREAPIAIAPGLEGEVVQ